MHLFYPQTPIVTISDPEAIAGTRCEHATGIFWDSQSEALYFIDRGTENLHRLSIKDWKTEIIPLDIKPSFAALTESVGSILVGNEDAIKLYSLKDGKAEYNETVVEFRPELAASGKCSILIGSCSPYGEIFVGFSRPRNEDLPLEPLFRLLSPRPPTRGRRAAYSLIPVLKLTDNVRQPVGLCWDHGGRSLYLVDSTQRKLLRYVAIPFRDTLENKEEVFDFSGISDGIPHAVTVDCRQFVWVAMSGTGEVFCIDPTKGTGKAVVVTRKVLPALYPTSCAFGGPALQDLYITTRRLTPPHGSRLNPSTHGGDLYRISVSGMMID
jgi:sugar lactone lactonase YvrE